MKKQNHIWVLRDKRTGRFSPEYAFRTRRKAREEKFWHEAVIKLEEAK